MLPVLATIGPVRIYSMGVCLVVGLFLGLYYWWKLGRDEHWEEIALFDTFFLSLISFFIFGRLGYVMLHWSDLGTFYRIVAFLTYPGLSYLAGIFGSLVAVTSIARAKEWDVWKVLDIYVVAISLILIFGFTGSLLNGSNPGRESPLGLVFPGESGRRLPVDLWGVLWALSTFGLAIRIRKNFRFYAWYKGNSSVAKDGLAALSVLGMIGLYTIVFGWLDDGMKSIGPMPIISLSGILIMIGVALVIYIRSGSSIKQLVRRT